MDEETPSKITIVYEEAEGKRTISASGAQGGVAPNGNSIVANFYVERGSVPHHVQHEVNEEGRVDLDQPIDAVTRGEVTREIQTTMVMTPEDAYRIGQWLMQHAEGALQRRGDDSGSDSP